MLQDMGSGIFERCDDKDAFFIGDTLRRRLYRVEVHMLDGCRIDDNRLVMVENDGCIQMSIPSRVLIRCHLHGRFRWPPANKSNHIS